jgi:hypothetical protein
METKCCTSTNDRKRYFLVGVIQYESMRPLVLFVAPVVGFVSMRCRMTFVQPTDHKVPSSLALPCIYIVSVGRPRYTSEHGANPSVVFGIVFTGGNGDGGGSCPEDAVLLVLLLLLLHPFSVVIFYPLCCLCCEKSHYYELLAS